MKNYVQPGKTITLAAPYGVASGAGLLVGAIFGVASTTAIEGADVETSLVGVYDLAKRSAEAWTAGNRIYWDDDDQVATNVSGSSNVAIGVAIAAAANPSASGRVRLNGSF